jgi:hypothetical protein
VAVTLSTASCARMGTMAGGVARAIRLVELMKLFYAGGRYTTRDLAQRFECSTDTILRDIDALDVELHLPLLRVGWEWELYEINDRRPN